MLSLEQLASLDLSIWLRSGDQAAERQTITQPTVSRRVRQCLDLFELRLVKQDQEWSLRGASLSLELLTLERQVHQTARWMGHAPLRIEGTYWNGPLLLTPEPEGWMGGRHDVVGVQRPMEWLEQRLIDGWLAAGPDWPPHDDPLLATIPLCTVPVHAVVAPGHPLLRRMEEGHSLDWVDVAAFPSLALPKGAYPRVEASLKALGLWSSPSRMARYRRELWEGKSEDELMVGYATVLSEQVAGTLVRLPLRLPLASGEALVLRREWADHPRSRSLVELLRQRLQPWARRFPELVLTS
jgi:DNA-binding transcriptional LysR family regulator